MTNRYSVCVVWTRGGFNIDSMLYHKTIPLQQLVDEIKKGVVCYPNGEVNYLITNVKTNQKVREINFDFTKQS